MKKKTIRHSCMVTILTILASCSYSRHSYEKISNLAQGSAYHVTYKGSNPEKIKNLAQRMSGLQPERYNEKLKDFEKILTETQIEDVLKGGAAREPEFLKDILDNIFEGKLIDVNNPKSLAKKTRPLFDPYRYISQESIEKNRQKIIDYVEAIIKDAKDNARNVDFESMLKMNKRNYSKYGLFMGLGMGVSALFLSTIIPKVQYYITYLRTGKNSFPGTENLQEPEKK